MYMCAQSKERGFSLVLNRVTTMVFLLAVAALVPSLGLPQWVTGPSVNALLIISVYTVGVSNAVAVGAVPSFVALSSGVLPAPMLLMIPFIVAGNAILVVVFAALRRINYWLALVAGAALKCGWLWAAVSLLTVRPFQIKFGPEALAVMVPDAMANMFRWPQFLTAVVGGLTAYGLLQAYRYLRSR